MSQLVSVTGGAGFVGSHIIALLLEKGYRVRAATRSASKLRGIFPDVPALEVAEMPTLVSDYSESLKGIDAIVHVAAPVPYNKSNDEIFHVLMMVYFTLAHVAALSAPPIPGRDKRFIISATTFKWKDVEDLIRRERPELANRLPKEDDVPPKQTDAPLDTRFTAEVLGLKEYIPWEDTALAGIDAGAAWEKQRKDI
ncbi:hypothetical protein BT96DRAFT_1002307 [Gymnopus androsaceus JB14]|uniref:NAD-dependent epimerase/dehydratase domain-containing protein n=1 Tax=Gymnopus androsaceus JB14 TaxID=1447944 RepID=A0A6A4GYK9_9AGAR|nr:hypothetical protein BT96DRAFT_1002307 [Gymnopus androsaceus JB14]